MTHPAFRSDRTALITGAASGIGLAAAKRAVSLGMAVVLIDLPGERLIDATNELRTSRLKVASIRAKRAMIESASRRCLLVNHQRFNRTALHVFADVNEFDHVITDQEPPADARDALKKPCPTARSLRGIIE